MKRNTILAIAAFMGAMALLVGLAGCKSSGMALTSRGQLLKLNIIHPKDLRRAKTTSTW